MIPSRRLGGIHPRPEISHRLQHCDEYARPLNLPLFSHINHYTQRLAEEETRPRRREAGGRRGRSIGMSAHRLNATETDGRPANGARRAPYCGAFAMPHLFASRRYRFHALCNVHAHEAGRARKFGDSRSCPGPETQKMESATAALLKFAALTRMRETTKTIRLAATRSA
jgi:hypothetical protein